MIKDDENRAAACLLGLACGDAIGAAVEFLPRNRFQPLTGMRGGGKFRLQPGQWTDDTSMALCLADSLLAMEGFDPLDQCRRYRRWAETGYNSSAPRAFGFGKTVLRALLQYRKTGEPYSGPTDSESSGNGSLMRLAPIPIFYYQDQDKARHFSILSSRTTHGSAECLAACSYFSDVLLHAMMGLPKRELFDINPALPHPAMKPIYTERFKSKDREEIKGSGYVIESLEAALWAFWHTTSFEAAVLAAANLGDDADTTAAICGQIAGAYYGLEAIPAIWLETLYQRRHIESIARRLFREGQTHFQLEEQLEASHF
ncbi:ADP-ribosylglycohydrolase family protein [Thiofilum flexile]|uniref:ADP-ribosylglycohydrolase family protein n=1 Tax=Thiofilum flexile TaxID=125627 RepID=UPI0003752D95|nr:ADP-ribosylglycohydrolase family protein [Thiofilum flexile]